MERCKLNPCKVNINVGEDRMPEVAAQIHTLDKGLNNLQLLVGDLASRLAPVLREEVSDISSPKEAENLVPLAIQIRYSCIIVEIVSKSITDILKRLEI